MLGVAAIAGALIFAVSQQPMAESDGGSVATRAPATADESAELAPEPEPQDETENWKTYRNEEYGLEFRYPRELTVERVYPDYPGGDIYVAASYENVVLVFESSGFQGVGGGWRISFRGPVVLTKNEGWEQMVTEHLHPFSALKQISINGKPVLISFDNESAEEYKHTRFSESAYLADLARKRIVAFSLETDLIYQDEHDRIFRTVLSTFKFIE